MDIERRSATLPISNIQKGSPEEGSPNSLAVQSKIIQTLGEGDPGNEISEAERQRFLRRLAYKEISDAQITEFLSENKNSRPLGELERDMRPVLALKDKLQENAGYRIFLNLLLSKSITNTISVPKILSILDKYPSPDLFERMVETVAGTLGPKEAADARRYGATLAKMLYGEKQEIWEQLKILIQEGEAKYGKIFEDGGIKIRNLDEEEYREVLSKVETHGDPWQGKFLKARDLEAEGVGPRIKIEIGDNHVWFASPPYDLYEGRRAVVGYIKDKNGQLVARTFYRSNSHGVWKYLPKYLLDEGKVAWFHKGHGEESISLPAPLQKALAYVDRQHPLPSFVEDPDFIFAGTARKIASTAGKANEASTFQAEVIKEGNILDGNFYSRGFKKVSPERMTFSSFGQSPDFSKVISKWEQDTTNYGSITIELFNSNDKKVRYMFCSDSLGRVWIGGIEINSAIGSTGLREQWVDGGDLTTPAYEYATQADGYGNPGLRKGNYVDMFKNYLQHVPVIRQYIAQKKGHR